MEGFFQRLLTFCGRYTDTIQLCDQKPHTRKEAYFGGWKCGSWQDLGYRDSSRNPS